MGAPGTSEAVGAPAETALGVRLRRLVPLSARGEDQALPTEEALRSGELLFPAGAVAEPFADVRDVAEVVVAALAGGERYAGRTPAVTGPRLLTWAEAVAEIAEATGRPLTYRAVPADACRATPAGFGVRRVLGREPRDFSDVVRQAAADGGWKG
ncbi:hypothetical protein [Streptomyces werraensis]|uniref:hypothetical protein n=1 Tax=Streptomyces werraensis TaxID=68284 RepID=UPI0036944984